MWDRLQEIRFTWYEQIQAFATKLRRLVRDGLRLRQRQRPLAECTLGRQRLEARLQKLIARPWENAHARRLIKRLRRYAQELFTFLDRPEVPYDNNHAERTIRPTVLIRKNSYADGSDDGADLQGVLTSIYRTLKQRGYNLMQIIVATIRSYLTPGVRPSHRCRRKSLKTAKRLRIWYEDQS